jgi:oligopeptide/dipeptide ABC transporter ATP-binding protein
MNRPLVRIKNLKKYFPIRKSLFGEAKRFTHAVDGVSFSVYKGETLGLVGESGCGKTTLGKCILHLEKPTSGNVLFDAVSIEKLSKKEIRQLRSGMQIVFQDPFSSLDPRMTVKDIVSEPFKIHKTISKHETEGRVLELLQSVGLDEDHLYRFPHEFSGGQRQRIVIARALALNPKFLVLDEPTASLDVSVQAQILNLLKRLQDKLDLTYLFISHDLSVVRFMSDRIAVMYLGKIVELASRKEIFKRQFHPYTKALVSAIPVPSAHTEKKVMLLQGDPPDPVDLPDGCRFHPRCPEAKSICKKAEPDLERIGNRLVACHLVQNNKS